jgi:hypothetical protein
MHLSNREAGEKLVGGLCSGEEVKHKKILFSFETVAISDFIIN